MMIPNVEFFEQSICRVMCSLMQGLETAPSSGKGFIKFEITLWLGLCFKIHNGKSVILWLDVWLGNVPLKLILLSLFRICKDPNIRASECYEDNEWNIDFRRNFGVMELQEWTRFFKYGTWGAVR